MFTGGRSYFTGVWRQAAEGASGQQEILKVLAPHLKGMNLDSLSQATEMDETSLVAALKTLERHDVVLRAKDGCYCITVELLRRWVELFGGNR